LNTFLDLQLFKIEIVSRSKVSKTGDRYYLANGVASRGPDTWKTPIEKNSSQ
jgi:hypothetical protein